MQEKETIGESVLVVFGEEEVLCEVVTPLTEFNKREKDAKRYRKTKPVMAWQAKSKMLVFNRRDASPTWAMKDDWIVKNPGDVDPYVYGNQLDKDGNPTTVRQRQQQFEDQYTPIVGRDGYFSSKKIFRAVQIDKNMVFTTPNGTHMAVKAGGYITEYGYGIAQESKDSDYDEVDKDGNIIEKNRWPS